MGGLKFTRDEEAEYTSMTTITPKTWTQRFAMLADKRANSVGMFFVLLVYSVIGYIFFKPILNQLLYISNVYQLIALPILGVATGLSTVLIMRFLFRIYLEIRKEIRELWKMREVEAFERAEMAKNQRNIEKKIDVLIELAHTKGEL